jgi:outer membrane lipoprotein
MTKVRFMLTVTVFTLLTGCSHVISRETLSKMDPAVTFAELLHTSEAYEHKMVLLGGIIVDAMNKKNGTLLEIYRTEIDGQGKPVNVDTSGGRFLALYNGFLEVEIYRKGRMVTIAGLVKGKRTGKVGEVEYQYPYIVIKEIHLWTEEEPVKEYPHSWRPWYRYPYYPFYPYWW